MVKKQHIGEYSKPFPMEKEEEKIEVEKKLTESQLDALYFYLAMNSDSFSEEELNAWKELMSKLDKDFYEY